MKKNINYKQYRIPGNYSIPRAILDILLDIVDHLPLQGDLHHRWRSLYGYPERPMWRYNQAIAYLKKRKEISIIEKNSKTFLKLTRKGKLRALLLRLYRDFGKQAEWDGKWRLIMWDIPEKYSKERDNIRNLVRGLEFYQLQESAYVTPYILPQSAVDYLRDSKLMKYVRFLRVERFENDKFLKRHFKLK